jgi:hypothetical protein
MKKRIYLLYRGEGAGRERERERRGEAARCFAAATHVQRRGRLAAGFFAAATDREKELETREGKHSREMRKKSQRAPSPSNRPVDGPQVNSTRSWRPEKPAITTALLCLVNARKKVSKEKRCTYVQMLHSSTDYIIFSASVDKAIY